MARTRNRQRAIRSSGNVFADLGLRHAEEMQTKARLAVAINRVLEAGGISQVRAARILNVSQPKISSLEHYQLRGFSVERLMRFLNRLECDVEIVIRRKKRRGSAGRILVTAA